MMKVHGNGLVMYSRPLPPESVLGAGSQQGGTSENRSRSSSAILTGGETFPAPSLSQALWDMGSQTPTDTTISPDTTTAPASERDALLDELHKWAEMTVAEKIRAQYLESKGLSEEEVAAMSPEDRAAIEAEIREAILRQNGIEDTNGAETSATNASQAL